MMELKQRTVNEEILFELDEELPRALTSFANTVNGTIVISFGGEPLLLTEFQIEYIEEQILFLFAAMRPKMESSMLEIKVVNHLIPPEFEHETFVRTSDDEMLDLEYERYRMVTIEISVAKGPKKHYKIDGVSSKRSHGKIVDKKSNPSL